jgi:hypothetical protein
MLRDTPQNNPINLIQKQKDIRLKHKTIVKIRKAQQIKPNNPSQQLTFKPKPFISSLTRNEIQIYKLI